MLSSATHFAFFSVFIRVTYAGPFVQQYDRGWRPMSTEEAFRRFKIQKPHSDPWDLTTESTADNYEVLALKSNAVNIVEPLRIVNGFEVTKDLIHNLKKQEEVAGCKDVNSCQNNFEDEEKPEDNLKSLDTKSVASKTKYTRIAKKISEQSYENQIAETKDENDFILGDKDLNEKEINSYEVNEKAETENLHRVHPNVTPDTPGYTYNPPEITKPFEAQINLTHNLVDILSKYNIKNQDGHNYAISRQIKRDKLFKPEVVYVPIFARMLYGSNSNNVVPVDSALAVLLSNYGLYLPGFYGPVNRYRNLYGYLASNNIHNNKPFGMYKLYSDTDSSN